MGRWSDVQEGRIDLMASDSDDNGLCWSLYRVLIDDEEEASFLIRLGDGAERVRMEICNNLPAAVARCVEWMKQ